jgi:alpha-glucosidase (family GH31 glycosyl hydrolase)
MNYSCDNLILEISRGKSMLDYHLRIKTTAKSSESSFIYWQDYRISILFSKLIRIEKNKDKYFNDQPTQGVWYRKFDTPKFSHKEINKNLLLIETKDVELYLHTNFKQTYVVINKKKILLSKSQNLLGTYKTLDGYNGLHFEGFDDLGNRKKITLEDGVVAKNGIALLDDSKSLIINELGQLEIAKENHLDVYIFCFGKDYRLAVKALYEITGYVPLIPKYALGNWWSRYYEYSDKTYLKLMNHFLERDIPLTVATIDMDWHYNSHHLEEAFQITKLGRNNSYYGGKDGWTGYSWNKKLFPNYKQFLKELHTYNVKIPLNLHPAGGIRWFEDVYEQFAKAMGLDHTLLQHIPFDFTNPNFINNYFRLIHKPYENDGVDFWWIDWQQGSTSKLPGLDPLWALNHYHYLDIIKEKKNGIILSRYSGIGSHRYPVGFSGDTLITWETLKFLPYFTNTATNAGYFYWSHDIGGHFAGISEYELYLRFVQFGVFSPINRLHGTCSPIMSKEPWYAKNGTGLIAENFLRLRHQLIPFLYSASYLAHTEALALIEPLYYEVKSEDGYKYPNQSIFAQQSFILPISSKIDESGLASVKGFLPRGRYIDFFTHNIYELEKDQEIIFYRHLDSFPFLLKAGAVVPLSLDKGNSITNPKKLRIVTSTGNNEYCLYEDLDENNNVIKAFTKFKNTLINNEQTLKISFDNVHKVIKNRTLIVDFIDSEDVDIIVTKNGQKVNYQKPHFNYLRIEIDVDLISEYELTFLVKQNKIETIKKQITKTFYSLQFPNPEKEKLYQEIMSQETIVKLRDTINNSDLLDSQKSCLLEFII